MLVLSLKMNAFVVEGHLKGWGKLMMASATCDVLVILQHFVAVIYVYQFMKFLQVSTYFTDAVTITLQFVQV